MSLYEELADMMMGTTGWAIAAHNVPMPDRAALIARLKVRFPVEAELRAELAAMRTQADALNADPNIIGLSWKLPPGWKAPPRARHPDCIENGCHSGRVGFRTCDTNECRRIPS